MQAGGALSLIITNLKFLLAQLHNLKHWLHEFFFQNYVIVLLL